MAEKERIEHVMQKVGMNSTVFASEIGIQSSTLSHILNGRNNPSLSVLQSILNRFPNISPEWLIMGQGSVERNIKQSQELSLFDNIDENASKSGALEIKKHENPLSGFLLNQQKTNISDELPLSQPTQTVVEKESTAVASPAIQPVTTETASPRTVRKVIVYYSDNTFQEFQ